MIVNRVERYTIPLEAVLGDYTGTTVFELWEALGKLPAEAVVSIDFGANNLFATNVLPNIKTH